MHTTKLLFVLTGALGLAACNHVEATHNLCGGTTACAKGACDPIDVLSDRPNRPFRELGVVQVRVDRGTALRNVTLEDAMPALVAEARSMGADAVILTHEEFTSWYDKGEPASPIHDLERQESWYITEKARYVSGLAVVYTAPACAAPTPGAQRPAYTGPTYMGPTYMGPTYTGPSGGRVVQTRIIDAHGNVISQPAPAAPAPVYVAPAPEPIFVPAAPPAPAPLPTPAPELVPPPAPADVVAPSVPEVPSVPDLPPVPRPDAPIVPDVPPVPPPPPDMPK